MGLCLICQAAVSSTLKFISEGPQSAVAVAPLATLSPRDTSNDSDAPKQRGAAPGASRPGHPFIPNRMIGTVPSSASSATLHGENKAVPSHPANARGVRPGM